MTSISPLPLHYGLGCALLSLYGTQVCPFVDSLSFVQLVAPIVVTFGSLYVVRGLLRGWLAARHLSSRIHAQVMTDLVLFFVGGVSLATFNFIHFDFPIGSGLKILLGMFVLGFFTACDLGLRSQRRLAICLSESMQDIEVDQYPFPLTKKIGWIASIFVVILATTILLVVAKDLAWLMTLSDDTELSEAVQLVALEIGFVSFVVLSYLLVIISNYGSNVQMLFDFQRTTLNQVANGQMSVRVPVSSNDEFGVIAKHTNHTIETLRARTLELDRMRDVTILALASLAETRDNETGAHILRTQHYVKILAEHLKTHSRFKSTLSPAMIDLLYKTAPLHDSGKVGIPDAILHKPGQLTDDEFEIMKQHPLIGSRALQSAQDVLGGNSFLSVACEIMETHHEKWDGSGYPAGLVGEEIPISGRLMALADVYDALISARVYKPAFSHVKARDIIVDGRGTHFDPDVVDAFLELESSFQEIAMTYSKPGASIERAA